MAVFNVLSPLLVLLAVGPTLQENGTASVRLRDVLPVDYDCMRPPRIQGRPADVNVSVYVLNIRSVDEGLQFVEMDLFVHQRWKDMRLKAPKERITIDPRWRQDIWTPELYFKNSADGRMDNVIIPYTYITLDPTGTVFMAARVSLKLACSMDLTRFPHDIQLCDMMLSSLIHTNDSVAMRWKTFMITRNLSLSEFGVLEAGRGDCSLHYDVGDFSCLYGRMELRRHLGYFLINKYAPSSLIVIMSFVSFWMPPKAYPARVTLSVTSLLTIVTQQYQASMPGVSYVVALNVWMIVCITFVFLGLVECAFVVTCDERDNARANGKDSWWPRPALIDHCARILFPGALLLHAFVYWGVYWRE